MYSGIVAPQDQSYIDSFKKFEECTGITIEFQGDKNFDTQIQVRIQGGDAPDISVFAQPGVISQLVQQGKIVEAPQSVTDNLNKFWSPSWQAYVVFDGKTYGAPNDANVKSLIWYSPKAFAAAGYQIPTTLDELKTLSDTIAATGVKPWCDGIAAGDATGWPVTDWVSEMMLLKYGTDTYDKWVSHGIAFNSPEVTGAMDAAGDFLKNPKWFNGGFGDVSTIATTEWQDAGVPVTTGKCFMYKQGSFYGQMWPEGTTVAPDGDVYAFYFPSDDSTKPIIGGGSFVVAFSSRPEVQAFQTFLSSDTWADAIIAATPTGGWTTANKGADASALTNPIDKLSMQILQDENAVFRYGGADLMPPAAQTAFWAQGTQWVLGQSTKDTVDAIEAAWPTS